MDYSRYDPPIDPIFEAMSDYYWSSSSSVIVTDCAWVIYFYDGYMDDIASKGLDNFYVRAVRSGP